MRRKMSLDVAQFQRAVVKKLQEAEKDSSYASSTYGSLYDVSKKMLELGATILAKEPHFIEERLHQSTLTWWDEDGEAQFLLDVFPDSHPIWEIVKLRETTR